MTDEEYVSFWKFWLWQYTARNTEYRADYEKYVNARIPMSVFELASKTFRREFSETLMKAILRYLESPSFDSLAAARELLGLDDQWETQTLILRFGFHTKRWWFEQHLRPFQTKYFISPKDPNEDTKSHFILEQAINGNLDRSIPLDFIIPNQAEQWITDESFFSSSLDRPPEQIIAELKYFQGECFRSKLERAFIDTFPAKIKPDDEIRAIGLRLWDMKHGRLSDQPVSALAREVYEQYLKTSRFGQPSQGSSNLRRLERALKASRESIEEREIRAIR